MSSALRDAQTATATRASRLGSDPRYQASMLMRLTFTVAPVAFGLDKFWNQVVYWPAVRDFGRAR